jgi:hypothetical protein
MFLSISRKINHRLALTLTKFFQGFFHQSVPEKSLHFLQSLERPTHSGEVLSQMVPVQHFLTAVGGGDLGDEIPHPIMTVS